jgi:hypothetical protein
MLLRNFRGALEGSGNSFANDSLMNNISQVFSPSDICTLNAFILTQNQGVHACICLSVHAHTCTGWPKVG